MQVGRHEVLQGLGIPVSRTPVRPKAAEVGGAAPSSGVGTLTPLPTPLLTQTLVKRKGEGPQRPSPRGPQDTRSPEAATTSHLSRSQGLQPSHRPPLAHCTPARRTAGTTERRARVPAESPAQCSPSLAFEDGKRVQSLQNTHLSFRAAWQGPRPPLDASA